MHIELNVEFILYLVLRHLRRSEVALWVGSTHGGPRVLPLNKKAVKLGWGGKEQIHEFIAPDFQLMLANPQSSYPPAHQTFLLLLLLQPTSQLFILQDLMQLPEVQAGLSQLRLQRRS